MGYTPPMSTPSSARKMSPFTVSMLIVVTTFGFANVIDNVAELGLAAISSWVVVGVLYFLPLALILAEFASDNTGSGGGIYSFMERGLGPTWAFVGTWSYFVANLVYLQSAFSRLPIRTSLAVSGVDVFESVTWMLPLLGVLICVALTWVASRGVRVFSILGDWLGKATLVLIAALVLVPFVLFLTGRPSATPITAAALVPSFDLNYFSTFAWLLFAVAGAEVAAPYVKETENPQKSFPRAILMATGLIAGAYILASIALVLLMPVETVTKATGMYDVWVPWAESVGLPGGIVGRLAMTVVTAGSVAAYVIWVESPIRAMFSDVPRGTFPARLTRADEAGTLHHALWTQAAVVIVLILIPLLSIVAGMAGSEAFIGLLNDLASLSLVVPYVFLALAYIRARRAGMDAPFKMVKSTPVAVGIGVVVLAISAAGYLGAGLYALQSDPIDWVYVGIVYGGPVLLVLLGLLLRLWSLRTHASSKLTADDPSGS
ncbi:MAG: amino acid transporter [Kiritimatiellia bacterium]|jgi:amino acid transporter